MPQKLRFQLHILLHQVPKLLTYHCLASNTPPEEKVKKFTLDLFYSDKEELNRTYFPHTKFEKLKENEKEEIISEIENEFKDGLNGIKKLPLDAKFGVFMAYRYYFQLLKKLKKTPASEIINKRIRVPNFKKIEILTRGYVKYQLNLI